MATRYNPPDNATVLHFITLNVRERKHAFQRPVYASLVLELLAKHCNFNDGRLFAYVVMPDHVHFIIWLPEGNIKNFLTQFKPGVTSELDSKAGELGHYRAQTWLRHNGRRELWQDGKHDVPLWSGRFIRDKINYIHQNPVRAGFVEYPQDYPWSSYGAYFPNSV